MFFIEKLLELLSKLNSYFHFNMYWFVFKKKIIVMLCLCFILGLFFVLTLL